MKTTLVAITLALFPAAAIGRSAGERVETNGITLNVVTFGDRQNSPVVLMHGWMGTSHSWRKVAPLLAEEHFVIVPDMRGYAGSDKPSAGYDAVNLAADMAGLLDHYDLEAAHMVGHDMGALVSLAFAGTYPERTVSMTYLDEPLIGYNLDEFTVYSEPYGGFWHFGFNTAPGLAELLIEGREQAFVDYFIRFLYVTEGAVTEEDRRIYADSLRMENGIAGSVGWYRATFETARQLRAIGDAGVEAPMMAWGAEFGLSGTHAQFEAISDEVEGGIVPGVGHLIPEEAPDFLAEELLRFFARAESE